MRGKAFFFALFLRTNGITPAYAGKSSCGYVEHPLIRDHPRVCGEKPRKVFSSFAMIGSPPRMRGKDAGLDYNPIIDRITPAYAGKSARSGSP